MFAVVAVWPARAGAGAGVGGGRGIVGDVEVLDGDEERLLLGWLVCRDSGRC